jgi:acyl-CoA thioesterase FadM
VNLLYRLIRVVIQSLFRDPIGFFDSSTLTFRVLPNDLDLNMHMTNSRYLSIMDLGRVDLVSRTKMGKSFLTGRWQAMLGAAHIRFRRGLSLFEQYQLITQVIGVDDKWVYIEQRFESKGTVVAYAVVRGVFLKRGITVSLTDVLEELGVDDVSLPPLTDALKKWKEADDAFKKSSRSD